MQVFQVIQAIQAIQAASNQQIREPSIRRSRIETYGLVRKAAAALRIRLQIHAMGELSQWR